MENPLISIIVPVYNADMYLPACLDSILNQTYRELEVILIDDGSVDNSGKICDEYAQKDSRIKVIHKQNGGVSKARNDGLKMASGQYIGFIDGDDTIHPEMFEALYRNLLENDVDISICDFEMVYSDKSVHSNPKDLRMRFSSHDAIKTILSGGYFQGHLCNKLFKSEVLKDIFFDEDIYVYEDILVVIKALMNSKAVFFDSTPYYHYYMRESSACHTAFTYKRYSAHTACERILALITESDRENKEELIEYAYASLLLCNAVFLQKLYYDKSSRKEFCKPVRNNIKNAFAFKHIKHLGLMRRIGIILARISTPLFFVFVSIKDKLKG